MKKLWRWYLLCSALMGTATFVVGYNLYSVVGALAISFIAGLAWPLTLAFVVLALLQ